MSEQRKRPEQDRRAALGDKILSDVAAMDPARYEALLRAAEQLRMSPDEYITALIDSGIQQTLQAQQQSSLDLSFDLADEDLESIGANPKAVRSALKFFGHAVKMVIALGNLYAQAHMSPYVSMLEYIDRTAQMRQEQINRAVQDHLAQALAQAQQLTAAQAQQQKKSVTEMLAEVGFSAGSLVQGFKLGAEDVRRRVAQETASEVASLMRSILEQYEKRIARLEEQQARPQQAQQAQAQQAEAEAQQAQQQG
ncbi:MAG: hypothetical protein C4294_18150 [Nitrospiraceae bacterium]